MSRSGPDSVTQFLNAARAGDRGALDRIYPLVYEELRRLAAVVSRDRASETLNATALVHEAYLKLLPSANLEWRDRAHFFRVAARAMRQILADAAERRSTRKRGGGFARVTLADVPADDAALSPEDVLDLDRALEELAGINARQAAVVECRFFAGLSLEETAEAVGASVPTVTRDWRFAKAWLSRRLREA